MITKQDSLQLRKDFSKVFATKQDLTRLKQDFKKEFATKKEMNLRFDRLEVELTLFKNELKDLIFTLHGKMLMEMRELSEKYIRLNDSVSDFHDQEMGELQTIREELTIAGHQHTRYSDQLESHDQRLISLESKPA